MFEYIKVSSYVLWIQGKKAFLWTTVLVIRFSKLCVKYTGFFSYRVELFMETDQDKKFNMTLCHSLWFDHAFTNPGLVGLSINKNIPFLISMGFFIDNLKFFISSMNGEIQSLVSRYRLHVFIFNLHSALWRVIYLVLLIQQLSNAQHVYTNAFSALAI